uniref:F-box domain-containing protein n=1 Tax=Acrobeloides nanus TaxID=290746 RepID=A0A914CYR8_9BILA
MTFIPSEILADIFQYLPAKEVHLNMELVCNKWFEIIERNASFLPKKVIPGEFEVHFYGVIRHYCKDPSTKNYTAPNSENFHSFWHSKYILQNLNLSNYAWKFDTLKKAFDTYGKPMLVENLAIRTGNSEAKNFYQDYMHMSKYLQPVSVKWFNTERLADLKFLRSSGFFQMKSIKTLEVIVQLPKRRPFSEMSLTEFVDFIGNADNNKKCLKKSMTLSWNFNGELLFAEQLVQVRFLSKF